MVGEFIQKETGFDVNLNYPDINITDSVEFEVWGVVTHTIHNNR